MDQRLHKPPNAEQIRLCTKGIKPDIWPHSVAVEEFLTFAGSSSREETRFQSLSGEHRFTGKAPSVCFCAIADAKPVPNLAGIPLVATRQYQAGQPLKPPEGWPRIATAYQRDHAARLDLPANQDQCKAPFPQACCARSEAPKSPRLQNQRCRTG